MCCNPGSGWPRDVWLPQVRPDIAIAVEACFKAGEKFEREQREKRLRGIFNAVDVDGNGSLSSDEFSKAFYPCPAARN